ncbi:MAG: ectonucleotide pyrophosphatase/phosphodiesterase [Fidelibacterota bacterium]
MNPRANIQNIIILMIVLSTWIFTQDKSYVVMVSFDGFRYDYTDYAVTPNFDRVAEEGVKATSLRPIFPSKTFPNHYAIATGMYAEKHGIIANRFRDPEWNEIYSLGDRSAVQNAKWYDGEPIWVTAEKQGVKTASYFWVGSEADIGGRRPSYYYYYDQDVPFSERVKQMVTWLEMPPPERPHLILLYFHEPDWTGHTYGPETREVQQAVQRADSVLGMILTALDTLEVGQDVNLIVCSDHGMTQVNSQRLIYLEDYIDTTDIQLSGRGPFAFIEGVAGGSDLVTIADRLRDVHLHLRVFLKDEFPARWHYQDNRRIPDLLLLADEGWYIVLSHDEATQLWMLKNNPEATWGTHGYDNRVKNMHAIFYATGTSFKKGYKIKTIGNIHIYPLITAILDINPYPEIDGNLDSVRVMLRGN